MSDAIASLVKYKTLPTWTESTLPESFQTRHNTKQGTWGKITVEMGQLQYDALNEAGDVLSTDIITPQHTDFFISPQAWHRVKPLGSLRCFVEFYCRPEDYFQKKYQFAAPHCDVRALMQDTLATPMQPYLQLCWLKKTSRTIQYLKNDFHFSSFFGTCF